MRQRIRAILSLDRQIRILTASTCFLCVTNNEDNRRSVGVGYQQQRNRKNQNKMFHPGKNERGKSIGSS
jgi:hypothetical protein